jgi:hypothetical protein
MPRLIGQCGARLERYAISTPSLVEGLQGRPARAIACGGYHSLVIAARSAASATQAKEDAAVFAFGWNNYGQLGVATAAALRVSQSPGVHADGAPSGCTHQGGEHCQPPEAFVDVGVSCLRRCADAPCVHVHTHTCTDSFLCYTRAHH